jgi:hypothetical protein
MICKGYKRIHNFIAKIRGGSAKYPITAQVGYWHVPSSVVARHWESASRTKGAGDMLVIGVGTCTSAAWEIVRSSAVRLSIVLTSGSVASMVLKAMLPS